MILRSVWISFFCMAAAFADEVVLTDGRIVEGKVEDLGTEVRVTKGKNAITFPKSMVKEIRYKPTQEEEYAKLASRIDPKDAQAHFELGLWCKERQLKDQAETEFRKVLEIDPNHADARHALGYQKLDDRWVTEDEFYAAKGMVKYKGEWVSKEEKELAEEIERAKEAERDILRQVRKALGDLASSNEKRQIEAEAVLGQIQWEYKLKIFIASAGSYSTRIRRYVSAQLGDSKSADATAALGRMWLYDQDEEVRANAERSIARVGTPEAILNILLKGLFSDRRDVPMRCVRGLRDVKDGRSVPYLVDLLQAVMEELGEVSTTGAPAESRIIGRPIKLPDGTEAVIPKRIPIKTPMKELEEQEKLKERERLTQDRDEIVKTLHQVSEQAFGTDLGQWRAWLGKKDKEKK